MNNVPQVMNCRASEIINLLKTKEDRANFCLEMSKKLI